MAKYVTFNAYDANLRVPSFAGINQYGDEINSAPIYARKAENVYTNGGVLQPIAACEVIMPSLSRPI